MLQISDEKMYNILELGKVYKYEDFVVEKKKIAIFSTGWAGEILYQYLIGLRDGMKNQCVDTYLFLNHAVYGPNEQVLHGELNICNLPDMRDFDAALIFANGLDFPKTLDSINNSCLEAGIPVIYTGRNDERFFFVGSDNTVGTKALGRHLVEVHGVKKVWFIAGSPENMDSNVRLDSIREVLSDKGYSLANEDICYTNWSPYIAYNFVIDRINAGVSLPDAIICANDTMAMVITSELGKRGFNVPADVIVTGFDNEIFAQLYDPSLSSVDQRFDNIGRKCAEVLIHLFNGEQPERVHTVDCEFIPSESCGCCQEKDFNAIRRKIGKDKFEEKMKDSNFDIKLNNIERTILRGNDISSLSEALKNLNLNDVEYEGRSFYVMIDPLVEKSINDNQRELRVDGYPDRMNLIYSKDKGYVQTDSDFETRKLVPLLNPHGENRFFILMPIHDSEYEIGYLVMADDYLKIKDSQLLRKYMERFNIVLNHFFQNLKLDALNKRLLQMTETDAMTHVKNRTAFETRLGELQSMMCSERKNQYAIAVFDVNNLKTINDNLGHEAGDEYIINCCRLICKTFKKSAVYRIGGDEFVAVLTGDDYKQKDILLSGMRMEMEHLMSTDLPDFEKLSIASGLAVYNPEEDFNVSDVFKRGDAAMYENKAVMKEGALR